MGIFTMKKAYTLLLTIVLITIFSVLGIFILETKSLKNTNLTNQYLYIQAKNHKNFLKDYIKELDLKDINHIKIDDDLFDICALSLGVVTLLIVDFYYYESLARQGILLLINSEYILVSLLGIFLISVPFLIIGFFAEYIQGKSYVQINRQIQKKLFLRKYNNDKIKR